MSTTEAAILSSAEPARDAFGADHARDVRRMAGLGVAVVCLVGLGLALLDVGVAAAEQPTDGAEYAWPLQPPPVVLTPFAAPDDPYGPGHRGVDLAGAVGQPVLAARGGTVVFAGPVGGVGVVSVQHNDGLRTTYEPVLPVVRAGLTVAAGDVLGTLVAGHRGCPSACLHWGVRRDRLDYLDPLVLLLPPHVRLLPVPQPWPQPTAEWTLIAGWGADPATSGRLVRRTDDHDSADGSRSRAGDRQGLGASRVPRSWSTKHCRMHPDPPTRGTDVLIVEQKPDSRPREHRWERGGHPARPS